MEKKLIFAAFGYLLLLAALDASVAAMIAPVSTALLSLGLITALL